MTTSVTGTARPAPPGRDRVFLAYCTGQAASWAGSAVHAVALPVVAVVELAATPGQVAVLAALVTTPAFLFSLPAGAIADDRPKRTIMIATDLASAATVTAVPLCWAFGALTMPVLYAVTLLLGTLTVVHQAAALAAVPELVAPERVPQANARLVAATSVADTAGTVAATALIALAGAVRALVADAVSYLVSAWCATRLPRTRPVNPDGGPRQRMAPAIRGGIAFVMAHPLLRPQMQSLFVYGVAEGVVTTFWAYWLLTHVEAGSAGLGLIMGAAGAGGLLGALAGPRLATRYGPGPVLIAGHLAYPLGGLLLLCADAGPLWVGILTAGAAVQMTAAAAAGTTQRTLRQHLTPPDLQSRAQQTAMWVTSGVRPFAALAAGGLAAATEVRTALMAGVILHVIPASILYFSPLRRLTVMPAPPPPARGAGAPSVRTARPEENT
ncbi:MFS transporter [Streptomyces sp. NPDC059816]|uniref:MFS transporter n=1 Tax=Streptomyces sp. NPDC059816 TaxID=3346960 RepID=UPI00364AE448